MGRILDREDVNRDNVVREGSEQMKKGRKWTTTGWHSSCTKFIEILQCGWSGPVAVLIANAVPTANYSASSRRFVHAGERKAVKRTEAVREEDRLTFRPSEVQRRGP